MSESKRPEGITDEHLVYLDELRESGVTNMFGGGAYVMREFSVDRTEASDILAYWMETFGKGDR